MEEICQSTMESKIASGLYFAGEILDYDGPCGGYNLNNAWLTGIKAGKAMAERIEKLKMYRIHQIKLDLGESKDKIPEKILKKSASGICR